MTPAAGARVLIAEDERHLGMLLEHYLVGRGHAVTLVADGRAALEALEQGGFDVALLDVQMPKLDGIAVLRTVRERAAPPEVIVMTGNGTVDVAITAMQHGAYDYLAKPYRMAEVDLLVTRAAERRRLERERLAWRLDRARDDGLALVTAYAPLRAVIDAVDRAAPSASALLVTGEPGTGRRALAERLHAGAGGDAFLSVDAGDATPVASLTALVPLAAPGTLHVARIEALAGDAQRALADALDAAEQRAGHPVRIVATSARDSDDLRLTPRLAARFAALRVALPALRARAGDVPVLTDVLLRRLGGTSPPSIAAAVIDRLVAHAWPGNLPELRVVVERAVARAGGGSIAIDHLGLP